MDDAPKGSLSHIARTPSSVREHIPYIKGTLRQTMKPIWGRPAKIRVTRRPTQWTINGDHPSLAIPALYQRRRGLRMETPSGVGEAMLNSSLTTAESCPITQISDAHQCGIRGVIPRVRIHLQICYKGRTPAAMNKRPVPYEILSMPISNSIKSYRPEILIQSIQDAFQEMRGQYMRCRFFTLHMFHNLPRDIQLIFDTVLDQLIPPHQANCPSWIER